MNTTEAPAITAHRQTCQAAGICVFLILAILAVFGQTARFEFVNYDDGLNVYENAVVQNGLSPGAVEWAFTHTQVGNWIPLTTLSHMLDCQLFGLHAGGHHLVNVLWHAAAAVLLFLVLRQMTGSLWRSAFVAAVFAIHPLRAESVAWVSERKDVLSAFFFVLTIGIYARYVRQPSLAVYLLMVVSFVLGLLSKGMLVTLPFVLLLLDYWPLRRFDNPRQFLRLVGEKIPLFLLSAAACVAAARVPELVPPAALQFPLFDRIGNALVSYEVYLRQMVYPAGLAIIYPNLPHGQPLGKICLAVVLLAAISAMAIVCRKKQPWLLVGWFWFLGMLAPVLGVVQISIQAAHADRYTYLPGIGLTVAATWALSDLSQGWLQRRRGLATAAMAAIGALMVCAHAQTSYWKNSESLWTHTITCTSNNAMAQTNLGETLRRQGKLEDALVHYRKAAEIMPNDADAINNIGTIMDQQGADQAAIAQFQKALAIRPDKAGFHVNLANVLLKQGMPDQAIAEYSQALKIGPPKVDTLMSLGRAFSMKGDDEDAIAQYKKVLVLQPDYADAHFNLGNRLLKQSKLDEAASHFRKAVEINPADAGARNNLGRVLLLQGNCDQAMQCFQQTTALSQDPLTRWQSIGDGFLQQKRWAEAIQCYKQASLLSRGGNPVILRTLATAYAQAGNNASAAATARLALARATEQKMDDLAAMLQKEVRLYETKIPPP